jgi:hypothetical protein
MTVITRVDYDGKRKHQKDNILNPAIDEVNLNSSTNYNNTVSLTNLSEKIKTQKITYHTVICILIIIMYILQKIMFFYDIL